MAEKNQNENLEDTQENEIEETQETEEESKGTSSKKEKTAANDMIPRYRLNDQKHKYEKQIQDKDSEIEDVRSQLTDMENTLKTLIEDMKKNVDPDVLELLDDDMPVLKQFKFLSKKISTKKDMRSTPKEQMSGKKQNNSKPTVALGGRPF